MEIAHPDFVAVGQRHRLYGFVVDVGAVETAGVDQSVPVHLFAELGVVATHGGVVEEDVATRVAARRGDRLIEPKPRPSIRSALDDDHRGILTKSLSTPQGGLIADPRLAQISDIMGWQARRRLVEATLLTVHHTSLLGKHPYQCKVTGGGNDPAGEHP